MPKSKSGVHGADSCTDSCIVSCIDSCIVPCTDSCITSCIVSCDDSGADSPPNKLIEEWCLRNLKQLFKIGSYYNRKGDLIITRKSDQKELLHLETVPSGIRIRSSLAPLNVDRTYSTPILGQFHVTMLVAELQRYRDVLEIGH